MPDDLHQLWETREVASYLGLGRRSVYTWFSRNPEVRPVATRGRKNYYRPGDIKDAYDPKVRGECECDVCLGVATPRGGHGASCYVNYGCRCEVCIKAASARVREYKERIRAEQT